MQQTITGIVNDFSTSPGSDQLWVRLRGQETYTTSACIYPSLPESNVTFQGQKLGMIELLDKLATVDLSNHDATHWTVVQVVLHPDPMKYDACTQAEFSVIKIDPTYKATTMEDIKKFEARTVTIPAPVIIALHGFLSLYGTQLVALAKSLVAAQIAKLNLTQATATAVTTIVNDVVDGIALAAGIATK